MNVITKFLENYSYRFPKGYPDMNNLEDKALLYEILAELNISEQDEVKPSSNELTSEDINSLLKAFNQIKEPYSRYLSVFYYFDPNSLGTVSEVLLAKLLAKVPGVTTSHVGGGQGLADIIVNGHKISLKTTASDKAIGLGSDEVNVNAEDSKEIVRNLNLVYNNNPELRNITVKELKTQIPSDIANKIDARIQSIAKKLSGDQNEEFFVWVEKISDKNKILNKLVIHVLKYDYNKIIEEFNDSILTLTPKAWGLVSTDKVPLVVADTSGKLLNITPAFVRNSSKDGKTIDIPLDIKIDKSPEQIRTEVPDQFFSALDSVYSSIFK
jgi:hypothetical protein